MDSYQKRLASCKGDTRLLEEQIGLMQGSLDDAREQLIEAAGHNCNERRQRELRNEIDTRQEQLSGMKQRLHDGALSAGDAAAELKKFHEAFDEKMKEIKKMEGIGDFFKAMVVKTV